MGPPRPPAAKNAEIPVIAAGFAYNPPRRVWGHIVQGDGTMTQAKTVAALAALVGVGLSAAGCCKEQEAQIEQLQSKCNSLGIRNKDLQSQLAESDARLATLKDDVGRKDQALAAKDDQIASLQAQLAKPAGGERAEGWERTAHGDRVTVGSDILFASGSATLTKNGQARLDQIAADITRSYGGLPIRVYGHTDSDPIRKSRKRWQDNLDLSANRAMAVTRYLISKGIQAERIETIGMGPHHPVTSNRTDAGKAKNRRVEIVVVRGG
jgi:chemotaxis protein MotB